MFEDKDVIFMINDFYDRLDKWLIQFDDSLCVSLSNLRKECDHFDPNERIPDYLSDSIASVLLGYAQKLTRRLKPMHEALSIITSNISNLDALTIIEKCNTSEETSPYNYFTDKKDSAFLQQAASSEAIHALKRAIKIQSGVIYEKLNQLHCILEIIKKERECREVKKAIQL